MAPGGFRPHCFLCQNLLPIDHMKDDLARDPGPTNSFYLGSISPILFCKLTPGPALVAALIPALAPALALALLSFDKLFKQFMKAYLESNQGLRQPSAKRKQFLGAKVLNRYYGKLHIDYYHFYQQYKDYFKTAGANGAN